MWNWYWKIMIASYLYLVVFFSIWLVWVFVTCCKGFSFHLLADTWSLCDFDSSWGSTGSKPTPAHRLGSSGTTSAAVSIPSCQPNNCLSSHRVNQREKRSWRFAGSTGTSSTYFHVYFSTSSYLMAFGSNYLTFWIISCWYRTLCLQLVRLIACTQFIKP